jgi:hypothetical protein
MGRAVLCAAHFFVYTISLAHASPQLHHGLYHHAPPGRLRAACDFLANTCAAAHAGEMGHPNPYPDSQPDTHKFPNTFTDQDSHPWHKHTGSRFFP